ncbi:hypothetical protein GCM10011571_13400 [Marinithermofilum abyssi]|uniref:Uncharacterized protein n=1 Tax=Marinithermofilum abyssi TaxID=1571185 RepID=A0A8J2VH10_9BACL|nr:hypothetical protein GCM10011571_13400 [Marinithermofilum abyssi]
MFLPETEFGLPPIRDEGDIPNLVSTLATKPDAFVSGDKYVQTPEGRECLPFYTPAEFMQRLGSDHVVTP